jgi:hypothetical protein
MFRSKILLLVLAAAIPCTGAVSVWAQNATSPQPQVRQPGFGAYMLMLVQPQHIKLGLAGQARNWDLAAHNLKELGEVFDYLQAVRPMVRGKELAPLVTAMLGEGRAGVDQAIKARDGAKFDAAYERLTQGCNACHTSFGQPYIVIQKPDAAMYPDQNFQPRS